MIQTLTHFPGQTVTIFLEISDGYSDGYFDGYSDGYDGYPGVVPILRRIILPDLTIVTGLPQYMIPFDTELYYYKFILPTGAKAVGNYLFCVQYVDFSGKIINVNYQVNCVAPYGNFSTTIG